MKPTTGPITILLYLLFYLTLAAQNDIPSRITERSQHFATNITKENIKEVLSLFDKGATILPEYHNSLNGRLAIGEYYEAFFEKTSTSKFSKTPFEIQAIGALYLELGTFEHIYETPQGKEFEYIGKYSTYWTISDRGEPQVMAHIWGASNYFAAENVDFIKVETEKSKVMEPVTVLEKKIEEHRKLVYDAVLSRDAKKQLTSYAKDAIYMTYYDPPFVGKDQITDYFNAHNNPDAPLESLMTKVVKVIDLDLYTLRFGEYYVEWIYEGNRFFITGKGLTLLKNSENGPLLIYRQMINHSIPATPIHQADKLRVKELLLHLDDQDIDIDAYLSVYIDDGLLVMPPGHERIRHKDDFKSYLRSERQKGHLTIEHFAHEIQSLNTIVLVSGGSTGQFKPLDKTGTYSFETNNLMVLERTIDGQLKVAKLIWNLGANEKK
ncbi:hypothetical protein [uncultured Croceitalea sp.]|uniref:hypothetical protein n=1 Tax=uncultured Croceitalea sp. TaxID=1798908 RepID=UPI003305B2E6